MISFTFLVISLIVAALFTVLTIIVGGAGFLVMFGDIIVCAVLIILIVRLLFK